MRSFLEQTALSIMESIEWTQLSRTTFVLPSHRAGLVLKDELLRLQQERHAKAVWAPQVQTLNQLQDYLSPLYAEDELFTIVRLYKIYTDSDAGSQKSDFMPLDLFYGWGRQMIADFTNIDASMHAEEVPNFFENTIAAHELEQWKLDPETEDRLRGLMANGEKRTAHEQSVRKAYESLWQHLYGLYRDLHAEMQAEQKGYPGMRQRAVIERWEDESIQQKIKGRNYVFVGFNYLLPVERELMQLLRDAGQAKFYWDYVPDFQTNEKAFSFTQLNAAILGNNGAGMAEHEPKDVKLIQCPSDEVQAQYVHSWLQENYTAKGQRVGVVICNETMLEPVIYTLPAITLPGETEPEPVNITKGFPLRNTAVYARALAWLNDHQRGKADDVLSPDFIDELLNDLFVQDTEIPESPDAEEASSLSWQELLILESEYQVRKIANQLRLLMVNGLGGVPFTLKLLRLLMRRMMDNVTMPFHGEPVTDIQVMGVLETRLLDFDRLLLLNVEEGVIPQRQQDSSFIPYYLRKAYHMQTPDERATVYAYNFFRLLSRAGHATLLYANTPSRFIMQINVSPEFNVTKAVLQEKSLLPDQPELNLPAVSLLSTLTKDGQGILYKRDGKRYRLSPSALNTYISCPRSFYLQYIEGLQPQDEEEVLFAPNTMGSFVHYAMQYIYTRYLGCDGEQPVPVSPDEIEAIRTDEAKMQEALAAAYEKMNEEEPGRYVPEFHASENVIILGYIRNILERDIEDAKKGLQIYLLEKDKTFAMTVDGVGEILIGGKIDRMDIVGTDVQTLRIVDYKSGSYNDQTHAKRMSATWEDMMESEEKGYVRQTLLYSHAAMVHDKTRLPIEPHLFFCRRKLTDLVTTIDVNDETVHDYRTIKNPFMDALQGKMKELLTTTDFAPCAPDKCPSFCPFFALCGRKKKEF